MTISQETFGTLANGEDVLIFTLSNPNGITARIMSYGAAIVSLDVPDRDRLLTMSELLVVARVTKPTIMREINDGRLRPTRVRGRTLFHRDDVGAWIDRCRGLEDGGSHGAAA